MIQHASSKSCLVNLISKDTHLVFSISRQASWFNKHSQALPGKLDIKRHSPSILYISASLVIQHASSKSCLVNLISKDTHLSILYISASLVIQQVFSKPCLINLISKDTHLVFSISRQASQFNKRSCKALPGKLYIKIHLIFSISQQASWCQQVFSKPCLVNLISKDTHLVFSIYLRCCQIEEWKVIVPPVIL